MPALIFEVFSVFSKFPFPESGKVQLAGSWIKPDFPSLHHSRSDEEGRLGVCR